MNIIIENILIGIISFMIIELMFIVLRDLGKAFIQKIKKLFQQENNKNSISAEREGFEPSIPLRV